MFLSFDIMGNVGFGKEFNNLSTGVEHPGIKAIHDHMAILGTMGHTPWLLNIISHLPGATSAMAEFFKWCEDEVVQKHQVCHGLKQVSASAIGRHNTDLYTGCRTGTSMNTHEM